MDMRNQSPQVGINIMNNIYTRMTTMRIINSVSYKMS